jgi:signal transduction histidine kinase
MTAQILIVDDDPNLRTAVGRWVERQGWTPIPAGHADDAMTILSRQQVDIALVDVRLPDISGLTLSRSIVDLDADIPILLMTGYADLETARQALSIGIFEYFTKPLDFDALQAGIDRARQHRRLAQENRGHRAKLEREVADRTQELTQINARLQREIEERKHMERKIVQLERLGALAEMSEGISHNLTGILGPAQFIEFQSKDEKILNEAQMIRRAALRVADLVKRLVFSVRGEVGDLVAIDVKGAINDAIQMAQPRWKDEAEAAGIHIQIETHLDPTSSVRGTVAGFQNMLLNLIFNAVDAMPKGGTIALSTTETDDTVQVTVSDTGTGMTEETKRRVFEPFFTTKAEVGRGLGMSGVYSAITSWGGHLDLESIPHHGTTVLLHLPK